MIIQKANNYYLDDCKDALMNSELGQQYFSSEIQTITSLQAGFENDELYIALNESDSFLGFIWYIPTGAFHCFPYLHLIAVKENYRGMGIGRKLLAFYEENACKGRSKSFLVVADFNQQAKHLYENLGYKEVGIIPDLYKSGVAEHLMMKEINS